MGPPASRGRDAVTFSVLAIAVSSFALLQSLVLPVLASFEEEFDTDQATVTWLLTGYLLSAAIATPLLGRVGDVVGKVRVLAIVLVVLSAGCLLAALAPSIGWLIAARVVQGLGGGVLPLSFGIANDEFRGRSSAIAILASLAAVGLGFGIVLAGPIVDLMGLDGLFWVPMAATALAGGATVVLVPPSPVRTPARLPALPAALLAGWLVALLLAMSKGSTWGWGSFAVVGLLLSAGVIAVLWVWVEVRAPVPIIDMRLMRLRGVWTANAVAACMGFAMFASLGFLPQLLQTPESAGYGFGATISQSGQMLLPTAITSFLMGFWAAPLVGRFGPRVVVMAGCLTGAGAFGLIAAWHDELWQVLLATAVQGVGSGLVFSSLAGLVVTSVPPEQSGVVSAMNANIRSIGGSLGSAVMAAVVTAHIGATGYPLERGYTVGFSLLAGALLLGVLIAAAMPTPLGQRPRPRLVHSSAEVHHGEVGFTSVPISVSVSVDDPWKP